MELWEPIEGYEGYYEISNKGRVKSLDRTVPGIKKKTVSSRIMKTQADRTGYPRAYLTIGSKTKTVAVHRLVYKAFVGSIPKGQQVDHIDGNKLNICPENLQVLSRRDHRRKTVFTRQHAFGERVGNSRLSTSDVAKIRYLLNKGELTQKEIAKKFDVHYSTIGAISSGRTWVHTIDDVGLGNLKEIIAEARKQAFDSGYKKGYDQGFHDCEVRNDP